MNRYRYLNGYKIIHKFLVESGQKWRDKLNFKNNFTIIDIASYTWDGITIWKIDDGNTVFEDVLLKHYEQI